MKLMWVVLRCVAAVWLSVTVCSAYHTTLNILLYATFDWLYHNKVSIYIFFSKGNTGQVIYRTDMYVVTDKKILFQFQLDLTCDLARLPNCNTSYC